MNKIFKTKKQKISEECWNLDNELVKWLNEHLKVYLAEASKFVDLTFYKHTYKGKEYTEKEIIEMLIKITEHLINDDYIDYDAKKMKKFASKQRTYKNKMYDLLKLVHFELWW